MLTDGRTDGRTDRRKIGRLYRTLLQAGAIKTLERNEHIQKNKTENGKVSSFLGADKLVLAN